MKDWFEKNIEENERLLDQMTGLTIVAEANVYEDKNNVKKKDRLYIGVFPQGERGFDKDPYFKVSWQGNFRDDTKVARISMKELDYVIHTGKSVEVPDEIIDKLNDVLQQPCTKKGMTQFTNWDAMLNQIASEYGRPISEFQKKFPFKPIPHLGTPQVKNTIKWGKD